ncbi:MAG: 4-alpha-glucanotransferase [Candidatus Methylomirabilia bacterium]
MVDSRLTPLERLAAANGIEPSWRDNWGGIHPTGPKTSAGLLAAMGVGAATAAEVRRALAAQLEADWCEPAPPVLVVRGSSLPGRFPIALSRPAGRARPRRLQVSLEIVEEDESRRRANFSTGEILHLGTRTYRDRSWDRYEVPLPGPFPPGYHTLRLVARQNRVVLQRTVALIVCPDRAYEAPGAEGGARAAGLGLALYGVRSERNTGIGDFGDLRRLTSWATRALGVRFIGLNPLHAIRNRYPYAHSPYLPLSSRFVNHLYLELEAIPEFAASDAAQRQIADAAPRLARLRATPHVPYDEAERFKQRVLRTLFAEFLDCCWNHAGDNPRRKRFEDYLAREGRALEHFALFQAIDAHLIASGECGWSWRLWPEGFRRPEGPDARAFLEQRREEVLFWQYLQWQLDEQLGQLNRDARRTGLSLGYYHDLALAVDGSGADTWAQQDLFASGARVGAPPDEFNAAGQDWGFPPPHPQRDRAQGYQAFAAQIRHACRHAGLLRIDHVMRLARLFWIPDALPASEGAYVRYRQADLLGILALESVRNRTVIVGEDLGVVPDGFRETMAAEGLCSCRLLWFERNDAGTCHAPERYPHDAMVSITTHDLATFAGFWAGHDLLTRRAIGLFPDEPSFNRALESRRQERLRLLELLVASGLLGPERLGSSGEPADPDGELHNAFVALLCRTPSRFFVLAQEDLFKVLDQQNVPGTVTERPNWVWRMPWTVEELESAPTVRDFARMYHTNIERSGRL